MNPFTLIRLLACPLAAIVVSNLAPFPAQSALPGDEHWDNRFGAPGPNMDTYGLTAVGNKIYVGGFLTAVGNIRANYVVAFDGTNWTTLNNGLGPSGSTVVTMSNDGTNVLMGGLFTDADGSGATNNVMWNGSNFTPFPGGPMEGIPYALKAHGTNLYVGGLITTIGGVTVNGIARWNGSAWVAMGTGVSGCTGQFCQAVVLAFEAQGNDIYAGGNFITMNGVNASYIARYDGTNWNAMGNAINGRVAGLVFLGGYLYASGIFSSPTFTNVARWDGATWSALPGGNANAGVTDIATDGTNLYVGGAFTNIGGVTAYGVAKFNGSTWSALGAGIRGFQGNVGQLNKILWHNNQLYVVGSFERAGNAGAANAARWDGTNWFALGGETTKGIPPSVNSVQSLLNVGGPILPNGIYAGGIFTAAGNQIVNCLGRFDGTNWNSVSGGMSGSFSSSTGIGVRALATDIGYLYAGGNFTNAGGNPARGIAIWNGANWSGMGGGTDFPVNALTVGGANYIYVGGAFTNVDGGLYSRGFAVSAYGTWYNLGNVEGTNGLVNSIVFDGGSKVYVGGSFYSADGIMATNIAYFDEGDFSWYPVGPGFNARVLAVAYGNGKLYAGGSFSRAGALTVNRIAQWDGTNWSGLGSGVLSSATGSLINDIKVDGTNVYVTGNFTNIGGIVATNIAKWNGFQWSALGSGLWEAVRSGQAIETDGDSVYVGGNFNFAGDKPSQCIARWNEQVNFYPPPNLRLTRADIVTNRLMRFRVSGTSGESYVIQASTNLSNWTPLFTNSTPSFDYTDTKATNFPRRIYRAVLGP